MRTFYLLCFGLLWASGSPVNAQQRKSVAHPAAGAVLAPVEGKELFTSYCANCHGETAIGNGPTAPLLKTDVADLTQLARRNKGVFPDERVVSILKGEVTPESHGAQEMPTWGPTLLPRGGDRVDGLRRVYSLVLYLAQLQSPPVQVTGKELFTALCASCHGENGKGKGPTAPWLKTPPADLTQLTRANHGAFPSAHVTSILQGDSKSHGTQQMPAWGPTLRTMGAEMREGKAPIMKLLEFVEQLQAK